MRRPEGRVYKRTTPRPALDPSNHFGPQLFSNRRRIVRRDDRRHPDAHVEDLIHFVARDPTAFLQELKDAWDLPASEIDHGIAILRQNARQIIDQPAAGDMGQTF